MPAESQSGIDTERGGFFPRGGGKGSTSRRKKVLQCRMFFISKWKLRSSLTARRIKGHPPLQGRKDGSRLSMGRDFRFMYDLQATCTRRHYLEMDSREQGGGIFLYI